MKREESKQFKQRQAREKKEKNISRGARLRSSKQRAKRAHNWDKKRSRVRR
ncbi:hypothetical protein LCGC14_0900530 [marine sediment metagenome]|uniref:Uncharacterized protein n=1 Tax=marine sediment metagenome TaxID=412755 RepID=A0A0F9RFP3_9ZZZZ